MRLSSIVAHPVLLGLVPVLSLYSENWRLVPPAELLLAVSSSIALLALAWLAAQLVYRNVRKSGLATSIFLFFFYSYGLLFLWFFGSGAAGDARGQHALLLSLFLLAFLAAAGGIARIKSELNRFTVILNFSALVVVSVPLATSLVGAMTHVLEARRQPDESVDIGAGGRFPDIYYIVPDAYARADVLRRVFHHDNHEFLDFLTARGFHVDQSSVSNYNQTYLSLASSLNLAYLQDIEFLRNLNGSRATNRVPLGTLIHHSLIIEGLKKHGYTFVTFPSGYHATRFENADILIENRWTPSEFQDALIATTPLPGMLGLVFGKDQYDWHRQRISNILDNLDSVAGVYNHPVFVFAHLFSPHPPFVFAGDGGDAPIIRPFTTADGSHFFVRHGGTRQEYVEGYVGQVAFLSRRLGEAIDRILRKSSAPPIIIVQSDHGSGFRMSHESLEETDIRERFSILNALYLPGFDYRNLPPVLSPVNTFRVVLNHYFGARMEYLENRSYYATWTAPYRFVDVTDQAHE